MKLGALSSKLHSPKRFALAPRIKDFGKLSLLADTCDYAKRMTLPWGEMANRDVGDCVPAARYHHRQACSANVAGQTEVITDQRVLHDYTMITGYDPARPETDNGTVPLDALCYWARKGEILGFGLVDHTDDAHVCAALQLFGGLFTAYDLPSSWIDAQTWDATERDAAIAGGHMVYHCGHDRRGNLATVTWGEVRVTTQAGRRQRCSEMWVIIDQAWLDAHGKTLQGLDLAGLVEAASLVD